MKHKRDDGAEKQDEETVDVTPIMICVFVVMCCSMLVLLYFFYDRLGTTPALTHNDQRYSCFVLKKNLFVRIHFYVRNRLIVVSVLSAQYLLLCEGWFASQS